ncbi:signal transduction histidine kinase [Rhizobium laguerreae]|uniref:histidine kinase n=1 Tax=Rhizobium laguerreae TaxID=1076926 RepID=A0ABR6GK75_9HYPH|nr:ATP-binding protein [Rhizobium laguerreae]MBB3166704.1 signal transduction histidine kinase [Rhizobium laguerreae]
MKARVRRSPESLLQRLASFYVRLPVTAGPRLGGSAGGVATPKRLLSSAIALYVVLVMALSLSCWSTIRLEYYRIETRQSFNNAFEAAITSEETRLSITRIAGWLRLASKTSQMVPAYDHDVESTVNNIDLLQTFEFLRGKNSDLLVRTRELIKTHLSPIGLKGGDYDQALRYADQIDRNLTEIYGSAVEHRRNLVEKAQGARSTACSFLVFGSCLVLVIVGINAIVQHREFAARRDDYIRSFALLHAHMTRSRVTSLRLFLDRFGDQHSALPEMLRAALDAVNELEGINNALVRIVASERDPRTQPLGKLLHRIGSKPTSNIRLEIENDAQFLQVPRVQVHLIVEELVNNAITAVSGKKDTQITIHARLLKRRYSFARRILIQISDTGRGMTSDEMRKAAMPFFSTGAGSRIGLGLTSCIKMVNAMSGDIRITSSPGIGTVVSVLLPVRKTTRLPE